MTKDKNKLIFLYWDEPVYKPKTKKNDSTKNSTNRKKGVTKK